MKTKLSLLRVLPLLVAGCSLPLEDQDVPYKNACSSASDCAGSAACVGTSQGNVCAATTADLGQVFLEVRSSDVAGASTSFLFAESLVLESSNEPSGVVRQVDLALPQLVTVKGSLPAIPGTPAECMKVHPATQTTSIPVKIELRSKTLLPGVTNQLSAFSEVVDDAHVFELDVPPGVYDVYIAPQEQPDLPGCVTAPPRFFPNGLEVTGEFGTINYQPRDESPISLSGTITVPVDQPLTGWLLEVVDPVYGRAISPTVVLGEPVDAKVAIPITPYSYTSGALLRLRAPAMDGMEPKGDLTVHWLLETVLDQQNKVDLYLRDLDASPVALTATVVGPTGPVAGASVTIQSKALTGSTNQNAIYRLVTSSSATGAISVSLLPGTYAVSVVPNTSTMGTFFGDWNVTASGGGNGIGFVLSDQPILQATVLTASGEPAVGAPAVATPSETSSSTYFSQAFQELALTPRQFTGTVNGAAKLALAVDPGTIDFSVQVNAASGFPWVVRPRVVVQEWTEEKKDLDLSELRIPYPVVVEGSVRSASGASSLATVRAWVAAGPANSEAAGALVQIGSTVANESGSFFLPLPPTVTQIE